MIQIVSHSQNPWRFSSKRVDGETGLIYFGCRYYSPSLGRWTTQDPLGYESGPNLYAYVSNCPLTRYDLYGLFEDVFTAFDTNNIYENYCAPFLKYTIPVNYIFSNENRSSIQSLGLQDEEDMGFVYINGINTTKECAEQSASYLSGLAGGKNFHFVHNNTFGSITDSCESGLNLFGILTEPAKLLHSTWDKFFQQSSPDAMLLHICHSQGAIHTRNALLTYPEELRQRIFVVAIAPAAYIYSGTCAQVVHYRTEHWWRDFVPRIDYLGSLREAQTIKSLPSHPNAPRFDHGLISPTYRHVIETHIGAYNDSKGKSI